MKLTQHISTYIFLLVVIQFGCSKTEKDPELPTLETKPVTEIMSESAVSGGNIIRPGDRNILQKGICWSMDPTPTIDNEFTQEGAGDLDFSSVMNGLNGNTTYYVRSYVQNEVGTHYGNEIEFSSLPVCRLNSILTPRNTDIEEIVYEYDVNNKVSTVIYNRTNGIKITEDYKYDANGNVEILENNESLAYRMTFNSDTLVAFNKYFSSTSFDINEIFYLADTAVAFVLIKPFGPGGTLIPIDSSIFVFNNEGDIEKWIQYHENSGAMEFRGINSFVFENSENPYRGLLTNFRVQGDYLQFVRYFNSHNYISVSSNGEVYREWEYAYDQTIDKTSSMTDKTSDELQQFNYENCN